MKTIDINLIGNLSKTPSKPKSQVFDSSSDVEAKTKIIAIGLVSVSVAIFIICFGLWIFFSYSAQKAESEMAKLKAKHETLKIELNQASSINKKMNTEKDILELKLLVKDKIDKNYIPWHNILIDLAQTVPSGIEIKKISKITSNIQISDEMVQKPKTFDLSIDGKIDTSANTDKTPLNLISYFLLNINENHLVNRYLSDAKMISFKSGMEKNSYDFSISAKVILPETLIKEKVVSAYSFKIKEFNQKQKINSSGIVRQKILRNLTAIDRALEKQRKEFRIFN